MCANPGTQFRKSVIFGPDRAGDELRLTPFTMRRNHQSTRHLIGDFGAQSPCARYARIGPAPPRGPPNSRYRPHRHKERSGRPGSLGTCRQVPVSQGYFSRRKQGEERSAHLRQRFSSLALLPCGARRYNLLPRQRPHGHFRRNGRLRPRQRHPSCSLQHEQIPRRFQESCKAEMRWSRFVSYDVRFPRFSRIKSSRLWAAWVHPRLFVDQGDFAIRVPGGGGASEQPRGR
jgi:hypothetical protein